MATPEGIVDEEVYGRPSEDELALWKRKRTQIRKQITTTRNEIDSIVVSRGSRGATKGLVVHLQQLHREACHLHTEIMSYEDDDVTENDKQNAIHLRYIQHSGETYDRVEKYLDSRLSDPVSENGPPGPEVPTAVEARRVAEDQVRAQRAEEYAAAQKRVDETRAAAEETDRALSLLRIDEDDHHSSASHCRPMPVIDPGPPVMPATPAFGRKKGTSLPALRTEPVAPDDWIDQYSLGELQPVIQPSGYRSSVSADLEVFGGNALDWFSWIDVFKALVHDTPKSPGEKLALLKRYSRGDCLDVIYGLGGGESAYVEALVRLKQTFGRRDVMRAAHIQAMEKIELKQDPSTFKRFAERIRTHFFDLTRIGETSVADLIERVCQRLSLHDRLAWNEGKWGQLEHRSLNDFGSWLCHRVSSYQNAHSIAAEQIGTNAKTVSFNPRRPARTHQGTTVNWVSRESKTPNQPFCFRCERDHRLTECDQFKELSIGERVTLCIRHHLCFCCFSLRHSVQDCPIKKPCKQRDCRYSHHELPHDFNKLPITRAKPSSARAGRQRVDLGMMRLEIQSTDNRSSVRVNVFVDEGSDSTLMTSSCASKLQLRGEPQILEVDGVGGEIRQHTSKRVRFTLWSEAGELLPMEASTMKKVANPAPVVNWFKKKLRWPHLADLPVHEEGGEIDLLIGMDYAHLLVVQESRGGKAGEPIASRTQLGWIV